MVRHKKTSPKPTVLRINRLKGRMLFLPTPKKQKRQILVVYGLPGSLESVDGLAHTLNKFGAVTVPDLPGLGGMSSFYSINEQPSIENYAGYLAAFIALRFHRKRRIIVVAIGEGTALVTKLLQNHKQAADRIESVISIGGILHHVDVPRLKWHRFMLTVAYRCLSTRPIGWLLNRCRFGWLVRLLQSTGSSGQNGRQSDIAVWQRADLRTYYNLKRQLLNVDVCNKKIEKPFRLIWANLPNQVDLQIVEQHALVVYKRATKYIPKVALRSRSDLTDSKYVQKSLGYKWRSWL